jgi:GDP-D-mannose dehydratase
MGCRGGDPSKAHKRLGWQHKTSFDAMVKEIFLANGGRRSRI